MHKVPFEFYAHSDKDGNWDQFSELNHKYNLEMTDDKQGNVFKYCGYEIEFDCLLDPDTGEVTAVSVNGTDLVEPITLT